MREQLKPDPMIRFLSLFWKDADAVHAVSNRLKMSNDERHRLNRAVKDETPLWGGVTDQEVRAALYRAGEQVVRDRVILEWASDGSPDWLAVHRQARDWTRPLMPVTGADLPETRASRGPGDRRRCLRRMEDAWIESDFALGRDKLITQSRTASRPDQFAATTQTYAGTPRR